MPRLETLSEVQRRMLQMFPCMEHDDTPWAPMRKPLSESKVALVTSAGLHQRDDKPFISDPQGGDCSYRVIPRDTPVADIIQSHVSIGFDHTGIYRDINVTFPMDRLEELKEQGVIGSLADNYYSYMGALRDTSRVVEDTGPAVARKMAEEGVDVVFLTPTWPLCSHAVSVLARCFEEAGISTTGVVFVKEHAERTKPPRMLWVPYAFGNALGRSGDPLIQHQVMKAAFDLLDAKQGPVLEEFEDATMPEPLLQASEAARSDTSKGLNPADELTALRPYYERWVEKNGGRTAVGVSSVPQRRFRGVVRFLEAYAAGEDTDYADRPEGVGLPQFIRYCVDDLKAFYYEARMEQRPGAEDSQIHEWYWGETAMSALIVKLAETMNQSEDPAVKAIPYGLAR